MGRWLLGSLIGLTVLCASEAAAAGGAAAVAPEDASDAYARGDYATALSIWRNYAKSHDQIADLLIGYCYEEGRGVSRNFDEAARWYKKPEEESDRGLNLFMQHKYNELPTTNSFELAWIFKAAENGNVLAQTVLGEMYLSNIAVKFDAMESFKWTLKAAQKGDMVSQFHLGNDYRYAMGVARDYGAAAQWLRRSAMQGDRNAEEALGYLYSDQYAAEHHGGPLNYSEAVVWYRKAAERGDRHAQFSLGSMYQDGKGVPKDEVEGAKWYLSAASEGDPNALIMVGFNYELGQGVPVNEVEALKWFDLAVDRTAAGDDYQRLDLPSMTKPRDQIASTMKPEQIAEARRLADEWKPTLPSNTK
jgi:TPR repeat protein